MNGRPFQIMFHKCHLNMASYNRSANISSYDLLFYLCECAKYPFLGVCQVQ